MKKNYIINNLLFVEVMTFVAGLFLIISNKNNNTAASSDDVISYNNYYVEKYLSLSYDGINNLHEDIDNRFMIDNVKNFDQNLLNNYYNQNHTNQITGTCTIVACLGMINYYGNVKGEGKINDSYYETFTNIFTNCYDSGYTSLSDGTSKTKVNDCLSKSFETYNISRKGNTEWYYLESKIRDNTSNGNPVIFDVTNHSTVVIGLTRYIFDYQETYTTGALWWKETKTRTSQSYKDFVIVNEGWGRINRSLIDCEKIKNITSGMQICYAEAK